MLINKVWKNRRSFRYILHSIYFNFHYLPFRQARHLPILLYKPKLLSLKGSVKIEGEVKFGMIRLGISYIPFFPDSGIMFQNLGGTIVFRGKCNIGSNSKISIGEKGVCEFGSRILASTSLKLVCNHSIKIGSYTRIGWDCIIMDTDFHKLTKLSGGYSKGFGSIDLGENNWFGTGCLIMKRAKTPNYCIVSARTILDKALDVPEYSIVGQTRDIEVKATGLWRNIDDDVISY